MKKAMKFFMLVTFVFVCGLLATETGIASELSFSVQTELPANQVDAKKSYFDLLMTPNQQQTLYINLTNDTDRDITIEAEVNSATTNSGGVVEYGKSQSKPDATLLYDLAEIVDVVESVELKAKSSLRLPLTIQMPEEKISGILVGGITLKEKQDEQKNDQESEALEIENLYSYAVAIVLQEDQETVEPELQLNEVAPGQKNRRNVITANLQNVTPTFVNKLAVSTKIYKKGQTEVLYQEAKSEMQLAPNSNFDFPVSLKGEKLAAGTYTMKISATSKEYEWEWERDFTIKAEEAKALNAKDVTINTDYSWLLYVALAVMAILVIVLLILLFKKKQREETVEK